MGNKELALRRAELISNKEYGGLPEVLTADVVTNFNTGQASHGIDDFVALVESFGALSDLDAVMDAVISEGDRVATRYTVQGTHSGEMLGVEPTGKRITFEGGGLHRVVGEKVAESWVVDDVGSIMRQLTTGSQARSNLSIPPQPSPTDTDVEANKQLVRKWIDLTNARELDALRGVWADDLVLHGGADQEDVEGFDGFRAILDPFFVGFPDLQITIEEVIGERDEVVTRTTSRGTFTGEFMDMSGAGQKVEFAGVNTFRIENGEIAEEWFNDDIFAMLGQIQPN